jgi:predicted HAD superfamily Cof-like phosphohydrolase
MRPRPTHKVQRDVEDFHLALGVPVCRTPAIRRPQLRANLIMEEAVETAEAATGRRIQWRFYGHPDPAAQSLVGSLDGLCDLLCVVYGTAAEFGVDLAPFWDEVHRTNMAKRGGPTRADGKKLKPDGWEPPDIAGILDDVRATAAHEEARDAE